MDIGSFTFFEQFFTLFGFGIVLFLTMLYGTFFGSSRIKHIAYTILLTLFLLKIVPASVINLANTAVSPSLAPFVLFGVLYVFCFFIIRHSTNRWSDSTGILQAIFSSVALILLILLASYSIATPDILAPYYPDALEHIFENSQNTFWIILCALVLLYIL